jgi:hypothetical protein
MLFWVVRWWTALRAMWQPLVDQPIVVATDSTTGRKFLLSDYNRDGDSFRCVMCMCMGARQLPDTFVCCMLCVVCCVLCVVCCVLCVVCVCLSVCEAWVCFRLRWLRDTPGPHGPTSTSPPWLRASHPLRSCASWSWRQMSSSTPTESCAWCPSVTAFPHAVVVPMWLRQSQHGCT